LTPALLLLSNQVAVPAARTTPTFLNQKRSTLVREESQFGWSSIQRLQCQRSPGLLSRGHNPNLELSRGWANLLRRDPATVAGLVAQSCDRSPPRQLRQSRAARIAARTSSRGIPLFSSSIGRYLEASSNAASGARKRPPRKRAATMAGLTMIQMWMQSRQRNNLKRWC
jgi:hypothetical protein